MLPPRDYTSVFVSYSWDGHEHETWVIRLAKAIDETPDLHVAFDKFDLWAGKDLTHFMDKALESERIVVISTPTYVAKASARRGGVGYECSIISAELAKDQSQDKFIPLLRSGNDLPAFLTSKLYIDGRDPKPFEKVISDVLAAIRREPAVKRPPKKVIPLRGPTQNLTVIAKRNPFEERDASVGRVMKPSDSEGHVPFSSKEEGGVGRVVQPRDIGHGNVPSAALAPGELRMSPRNVPYSPSDPTKRFPVLWFVSLAPVTVSFSNGPGAMHNVLLDVRMEGAEPYTLDGPKYVHPLSTGKIKDVNLKYRMIKIDGGGMYVGTISLLFDESEFKVLHRGPGESNRRSLTKPFRVRIDPDSGVWFDPLHSN